MKKKFLYGIFLGAALLFTSGCGSESVLDDFVLGKVRVSCAGETITVEAPFELGVDGKMAESADRNAATVRAVGQNRHMQIIVLGAADAVKTPETLADESEAILQKNPAVKNLKISRDTVELAHGDGEAVRLSVSFTDAEKGRETPLTVAEYFFREKGTLWRVIYQYRSEDVSGQALSDTVEGGIERGETF